MNLPDNITISDIPCGHVQGIALDRENACLYYSFTTALYKTDLTGKIIGSVKNLAGHLGCIAFCSEDSRIYGSLEYKHDCIGLNILKSQNKEDFMQDGFYMAAFDGRKIDRVDMDAEKDGIMTAVYLQEVLDDYSAPGHRFGCSGIDGTTFAPLPGEESGKQYLFVSYGIYSDLNRTDNDRQVLLCYDPEELRAYEKPLNQGCMHRSGPKEPFCKYFILTGNTNFGVQNLEYDSFSRRMMMAVYPGKKPGFPNYPMFAADWAAPVSVKNRQAELPLASGALQDAETGISGYDFPYGSCGMISLGNGNFYFSRPFEEHGRYGTSIGLYHFVPDKGFIKL